MFYVHKGDSGMNNAQYLSKMIIYKSRNKHKEEQKYLYVLSCEDFHAQNIYHRMTHTHGCL
jgi:hypothetical protein